MLMPFSLEMLNLSRKIFRNEPNFRGAAFQSDALSQGRNAWAANVRSTRSAFASCRGQKYCSSAALEIDDFTSRPPALTANITALPSSERCG